MERYLYLFQVIRIVNLKGRCHIKYFANTITISRMLAALVLFCLEPFSVTFNFLYIYCGISDMVDGFIARKTHTESKIGEILDSIADLMFVLICFLKILPTIHISAWLWIWILLIAIIKAINLVLGYVCQHKIMFLHTKANKVTGFLLFLLPLLVPFKIFNYVSAGVAGIATFAALQEGFCIIRKVK